jgi:hypothetical protein
VPQARQRGWVAYLTQHGSRLNKPGLVVLAHLNKLWAVLAMWHKLHVTSLHEQVLVAARQPNKLPWILKPLFKRHVKLLPVPEQLLDKPVKALLVRPLPQVSALWAQFKALVM